MLVNYSVSVDGRSIVGATRVTIEYALERVAFWFGIHSKGRNVTADIQAVLD